LVERRVLNVDRQRERCSINGLNQAKLRRVAFCVDVEIAPMPKYTDGTEAKDKACAKPGKDQKKKTVEKAEGDALKHPKVVEIQKEAGGEAKVTDSEAAKETPKAIPNGTSTPESSNSSKESIDCPPEKPVSADKKKEKKKKSEEERKARKEKRRKQAEANGSIPMELHYDTDSSSCATTPRAGTPRPQSAPTTNPVRIYRRCCQLRETPILRKITEQLTDPANCSTEPGMVEKIDLSGYWMQLPDFVTLGDYLAVVPVREVILDGCGLTDECLRVVLAGLLAAKKSKSRRRKLLNGSDSGVADQGGVVERLVLKNNKIGPEGWKHLCLFIYLCRTLKCLDLSGIPFPQPAAPPPRPLPGATPPPVSQAQGLCQLLSKSLGERLGGSTLGLISFGGTGINTEQLGAIIDGVIRCGVRRLGLANNHIDTEGLGHVARFVNTGLCEGLDLGGNGLGGALATLGDALTAEDCPLWALSLADCNLTPSSLCKLLPTLAKLSQFRFLDLSHNQELFSSDPSAVSVLRRSVPTHDDCPAILSLHPC
jgi:hypothetical protein